jgi:hypothetical protein
MNVLQDKIKESNLMTLHLLGGNFLRVPRSDWRRSHAKSYDCGNLKTRFTKTHFHYSIQHIHIVIVEAVVHERNSGID